MVPVEYSAGGAALVFHNEPEGTPYEYTYQVAYIEECGYHYHHTRIYNSAQVQYADYCSDRKPYHHNLVCRLSGILDILLKAFVVDFFFYGSEQRFEDLLRAYGYVCFHRDKLQKHIPHPYYPQNMQRRKFSEKSSAICCIEFIFGENINQNRRQEYNYPSEQSQKIYSSYF